MQQILFILIFIGGFSFARHAGAPVIADLAINEFQVISVKGQVFRQGKTRPLQRGDKFKENDSLVFRNPDSRLALVDGNQQNYIAIPDRQKRSGYKLEPMRANIGMRPGKILNFLQFRQFLDGRRLLAIGDSLALEIIDKSFEMNADSFFYAQYRWTGDTALINKRLPFDGQRLFFIKTALFTVDGHLINPEETSEYKLFYYNSRKATSTLVNSFEITFCPETTLREETEIIVKNFDLKAPKPLLRSALGQYIQNWYGEPLKDDLDARLLLWWDL